MTTPILEVNQITLQRGGQTVLHDISFSVQPGEVLALIGRSGSGKSSLLRCLNRLEAVNSGAIRFNGTDITALPVLELRQQIGMVFQKTAPFAGTVADNIAYGAKLRNETLPRERIEELMKQAALDLDLIDRDAHELSGGQEQRLAIARALANKPTVLLLDEPTSALDPIATHSIENVLLRLRDTTDLTLIWVSHNAEQARRVADRVLLLEAGRITREGTTHNMLDPEHGDPHVLAFAQGIENTNKDGESA